MDDLYVIQGSYQIEMVHDFLSRSKMTGSLLQLAIEWRTIHVSIGRRSLSLVHDLYGDLLPWSSIKNISKFVHNYGIYLLTSTTQLDLHKEGDIFLMEQFTRSGFTPRKLKDLNRYQLYLQIHTFYNISNDHVTYFDRVTMMDIKMNSIKPPTAGLIM